MFSDFSSHLPTPPQSPFSPSHAMNSSLQLLNNLTIFYQQQRCWTHHTRAALESVLANSLRGNVETSIGVDTSSDTLDDGQSSSEVKVEPLSPPICAVDKHRRMSSTLWHRRKNNLKLKLGGIEPSIRKQRRGHTVPSQHILDMFAELVEARVESCERVKKLVKHANRADLYRF